MAAPASLQTAAIAAHRFGLGEADLGTPGADPRGWLLAQIGPADPARGEGLLTTAQAVQHVRDETRARREARRAAPGEKPADEKATAGYREVILADARSRLLTAAATTRPFAERLQWFWANHFTVSLAKGSTRGLVGAFERDAIRPHIAGSFEQLLWASTTHPAMLRYLDNQQSAGPHSRAVVGGGAACPGDAGRPARHRPEREPRARGAGAAHAGCERRLLAGRRDRLRRRADRLARRAAGSGRRPAASIAPGTSRAARRCWAAPTRKAPRRCAPCSPIWRSTRPPRASSPPSWPATSSPTIRRRRWSTGWPRATGAAAGDSPSVYRELIDSAEAWSETPAKLKTPEEFVVSSVRLLSLGARMQEGGPLPQMLAAGSTVLGQRTHAAPSPAGWPDRAEEWLGPEAVWKRIEWATRVADRLGRQLDARALAVRSLGPRLTEATRAADRARCRRAAGARPAADVPRVPAPLSARKDCR